MNDLEIKKLVTEVGNHKEKDKEDSLRITHLEESTIVFDRAEIPAYETSCDIVSSSTMEKFGEFWQDKNLDVSREWAGDFEWPEWEDGGFLSKASSNLLPSGPEVFLSCAEPQMTSSYENDMWVSEKTPTLYSKAKFFDQHDGSVLPDTVSPDQVENSFNLYYKAPKLGVPWDFDSLTNAYGQAQESAPLEMNSEFENDKLGQSNTSSEIKPGNSFSEHLSSSATNSNNQQPVPAAPSAQLSLPAHNTTPPFICRYNTCGRSYSRIAELQRHQRVHVGTRSFLCRFIGCKRAGNGFVRKDHLRQHLKRMHGVAA